MSTPQDGMIPMPGSKFTTFSPLERHSPAGISSWNSDNQHQKSWSNFRAHPVSYGLDGTTGGTNGTQFESSLFSSSLSEIFSQKLRVFGKDVPSHQPAKVASYYEPESFEFLEEFDGQNIGHLLPDEDDLFSGVDKSGHKPQANSADDFEDFDLFSSVGGMELEVDDRVSTGIGGLSKTQGDSNGSVVRDQPCGENPSRTLLVSNINNNFEDYDLKALFEQCGDVRTFYTACKPHGYIMISYYDIRAARNAMKVLQNKPLMCGKLDIHYSNPKRIPSEKDVGQGVLLVSNIDSSISNAELGQIFGVYGDIRQIKETPHRQQHQKFIEFYDVRGAESALNALNRSHIAGKQIKIEPSNHRSTDGGSTQVLHSTEMKASRQCIPIFHPHSLPGYLDSLPKDSPYDSASTIRNIATDGPPSVTGVYASSGLSHGHHYMWNGSTSSQQHTSSPMIWSNSPSFINGVQSHQFPHMHGFPRAPPLMQNTASPVHHHIGSAPAVNSSFLDRQCGNFGQSPEVSGYHLGSLRNDGFPIGSPSHPMDIASHNMFSHVGGSYMQMNKSAALHSSPQQMFHIFPGRNPMISASASFDPCSERVRNFSHRRNELNSIHSDKKQYELNIDRIMHGEDRRTTLMIKNIPNKYTSKMLLATIDEQCRGTYDFIYLPIDFKNKCNVGYAFINMIEPRQIVPFYQAFNGKKWEKFNSEKVASLAYARIQGKSALIVHFQNSSLMNEDKRCRPILFHTDGPNAGDPEPFPMGTHIRSRPGKHRAMGSDEGSFQNLENGDSSSEVVESSSSSFSVVMPN